MKRKLTIAFLLLVLSLLIVAFGSPTSQQLLANTDRVYNKIKIFTSILETIQRVYIEEKTTDELVDDAIRGVLTNLDPHTAYLPADDFRSWNQNFEGYTGIGISFEILADKVTVMSTIETGPAARLGIQPGDRIVEIDGQPINVHAGRSDIAQSLMGPVGSPVRVTVESDRWTGRKIIEIVRERILLESVTRTLLIRPDIGYVKIERFTGKTSDELEHALDLLESRGMRNLILDLRGNSGGYLNAAIEVADKFIPGGKKILTTKGRLASSYQEYYATTEATRKMYPLIVLIDHGSASASEIVAGAIQDQDRGLILGETSFGKGLVQSQYRFHDGSALLITTAKYYTPSGRGIQRDYIDKTKDEYYREAYEVKPSSGSMPSNNASFKTLTGRRVLAGGGIRPDIIVSNHQNRISENLRHVLFDERRFFYLFCEKLAQKNPELREDKEHFLQHFHITDSQYHEFVDFVKSSDARFANVNFTPDEKDIKFLLKRELALILWDSDMQFKVNIVRDQQLNEAIKHFSKARNLLMIAGY